MRYLVF